MSSNKNSQVYLTGSFAAIGGLLFGYDTGVISGVLTMSDFLLAFGGTAGALRGSLPSSISGSIVGIMLVGCFLGALIAGPSGDRLSRKYSIVLFSVVFIVSAILQTASYNLNMLLLSRLVAGKIMIRIDCFFFHRMIS
jgi:MFS family permease